jgi:hypothetical protein
MQVIRHSFGSIGCYGAAILLAGDSGARAPFSLQECCKIVNIRPGHPAHPALDAQTANKRHDEICQDHHIQFPGFPDIDRFDNRRAAVGFESVRCLSIVPPSCGVGG